MGYLNDLDGQQVYLDTNVFIYALEDYAPFHPVIVQLFGALDQNRFTAITSELTLAELLVKPMKDADDAKVARCLEMVQSRSSLKLATVDRTTLIEAARLRADMNLKLPDAIHSATAALHQCDFLLTNDRGMRVSGSVERLLFSELRTR